MNNLFQLNMIKYKTAICNDTNSDALYNSEKGYWVSKDGEPIVKNSQSVIMGSKKEDIETGEDVK